MAVFIKLLAVCTVFESFRIARFGTACENSKISDIIIFALYFMPYPCSIFTRWKNYIYHYITRDVISSKDDSLESGTNKFKCKSSRHYCSQCELIKWQAPWAALSEVEFFCTLNRLPILSNKTVWKWGRAAWPRRAMVEISFLIKTSVLSMSKRLSITPSMRAASICKKIEQINFMITVVIVIVLQIICFPYRRGHTKLLLSK